MTKLMCVAMVLLAVGAARAEGPFEQNRRGLAMIERALEAHGGRAIREELKVSLTVTTDMANESQSVVSAAPFERYPSRTAIRIDQKAKRYRVDGSSAIAGDFTFGYVATLADGKGFVADVATKTWQESTAEPWAIAGFFPHRTLGQALQNRASVRAHGDEVTFASAQGRVSTLHFDPKSGLLARVESVAPAGVYGDGWREVEYRDYRSTGGLLLPGAMVVRTHNQVNGAVENVYRYENVTTAFEFAPGDFDAPAGYTKADYSYRQPFSARELARGVYLLENVTSTTDQWSYNVLCVVFDEFVLMAEAPIDAATTERVLAKVRELAPGKPIRYLVQSHHHGDHLGGIRGYVAEGTSILAGESTASLVERIAAAPFTLAPDRLHASPRKPVVEVVKGSKTIRDASREVVVYDIGPSPHAREMLVVYLPAERILYQSDMVNDGEYPENETTRAFRRRIAELGLKIDVTAGLHGRTTRVQ